MPPASARPASHMASLLLCGRQLGALPVWKQTQGSVLPSTEQYWKRRAAGGGTKELPRAGLPAFAEEGELGQGSVSSGKAAALPSSLSTPAEDRQTFRGAAWSTHTLASWSRNTVSGKLPLLRSRGFQNPPESPPRPCSSQPRSKACALVSRKPILSATHSRLQLPSSLSSLGLGSSPRRVLPPVLEQPSAGAEKPQPQDAPHGWWKAGSPTVPGARGLRGGTGGPGRPPSPLPRPLPLAETTRDSFLQVVISRSPTRHQKTALCLRKSKSGKHISNPVWAKTVFSSLFQVRS